MGCVSEETRRRWMKVRPHYNKHLREAPAPNDRFAQYLIFI